MTAEGERAGEIDAILRCHQLTYGTLLNRTCGYGTSPVYDDIRRAIAAALRAPQPRGLTGEAIREACAKALDERRAHFQARWEARKHGTDESWWRARMTEAAECAAALRALNLSAIEGAPAAGEREAAALERARDTMRDVLWAAVHIVGYGSQDHRCRFCDCRAPDLVQMNHATDCVIHKVRDGIAAIRALDLSTRALTSAPASPRSAAPEDDGAVEWACGHTSIPTCSQCARNAIHELGEDAKALLLRAQRAEAAAPEDQ